MQNRKNHGGLVVPPEIDTLRILEVYGDLENSEQDSRFKAKFKMLFTTDDVIKAVIRR